MADKESIHASSFLDMSLQAMGIPSRTERRRVFENLSELNDMILSEPALDDMLLSERIHYYLWENNPKRCDESSENFSSFEYTSLNQILEKDISGYEGMVANCLGLCIEYKALASLNDTDLKIMHLPGISTSHVYLKDENDLRVRYVNATSENGYDCSVTFKAKQDSIELDDESIAALVMVNLGSSMLGEPRDGLKPVLELFQESRDMYDSPEAAIGEAIAYRMSGYPDLSLDCMKDVYDKFPYDIKVLTELEKIYSDLGEKKISVNISKELIDLYPRYAPPYSRLREQLEEMGRESEAIPVFSGILEKDPSNNIARKEFYNVMRD